MTNKWYLIFVVNVMHSILIAHHPISKSGYSSTQQKCLLSDEATLRPNYECTSTSTLVRANTKLSA